jgi:hypothetical protein
MGFELFLLFGLALVIGAVVWAISTYAEGLHWLLDRLEAWLTARRRRRAILLAARRQRDMHGR